MLFLPFPMHLLAENQDVLRLVASSETLLHSTVMSFAVRYESDGLVAGVVFHLQHAKHGSRLPLRFKPIPAYHFAYSQEFCFYQVESFNFLRLTPGYYLSLYPVDECNQADERDNDIIRAETVQAYHLPKPESN